MNPFRTEEGTEMTAPLFPCKQRPKTTQYMDMTLMNQKPPEPKAKCNKRLGDRIEQRKKLLLRRKLLADMMLSAAVVGIVLMVIENEIYYLNASEKSTTVSIVLKLFISTSTAALLICICFYYRTGAEIKMLDARVDDPLAVTSLSTWLCLITELLVCAVHPFPGDVKVYMSSISESSGRVHIDGILSVLMTFRLYLVGRFLVVHSPLLTNTSTQTISAVSHVKIDLFFVFKAAMADHPGQVIAFTMLSMYSVSVWAMRTCELYYTDFSEAQSMSESMWLSAITFLTVGYGDLTPRTHCGRFISVITGLMGLASTALLVAVVAKKMEQTPSDKYVFNYLSLIHLEKKRKSAAADVIKNTMKVFTLKKSHEREPKPSYKLSLTYYSWKLSNSIRSMRSTRVARHQVEEATIGLAELSQQVTQVHSVITSLVATQGQILDKLSSIQMKIRYTDEDDDGN